MLATATLRGAAEAVTIVATGPLKNVALLLRAAPGLIGRIAEVSLMGGSLSQGNTTASAEFNIWADPKAAEVLFERGIPIRMAGLDVTHQALMLPPDIARDPNRYLSLGAGIHSCLGAPLARLELGIAFGTLLRRVPRLELVEPPRWKPQFVLRGLEALRVRV